MCQGQFEALHMYLFNLCINFGMYKIIRYILQMKKITV